MPLSIRRNLASVKHLIRCYEVKSELLQEREKWFENSDSSFFSRVEAVVNKLKTKPSSTERFLSKLDPPWAPQLPELTLLPVKDQKWNNFVQIYTDAAKANDSRCSAAFVIPEQNVTEWRRLTDGLAIAKCELIAVYLAIKWVENRAKSATNVDKFVIFSDSQKALQTISSIGDSNSIKTSIVQTWQALRRNDTVCFSWVKAHSGERGNELSDQAAKYGLEATETLGCRFDNNDVKEAAENYFINEWQLAWDSPRTSCGRFVHTHSPFVSKRNVLFGSSRSEQVFLLRVRLDLLALNHRLFRIKKHPTGLCSNCNQSAKENVEHVLLVCPAYTKERADFFYVVSENTPSLRELLDFNDEVTLDAALGFFKSTGIKSRLGF